MVQETIEILDHTADLAIRIRAGSVSRLFKLGARGVYQALGKIVARDTEPTKHPLELRAGNQEDLFHDWLVEILYYAQVRRIFFHHFEFQTLSSTEVRAIAEGKPIDGDQTQFEAEIKAVTYHHLRIERTAQGLTATVIFDI